MPRRAAHAGRWNTQLGVSTWLATLRLVAATSMQTLATVRALAGAPGHVHMGTVTCGAVTKSCLVHACWHAPRPLLHRIHVIPLQILQAWTPLRLADAVCCLLRRLSRSALPPTGRALGSFIVSLAFTLTSTVPRCVAAATVLVSSLAPIPHRPVGQTGGASSAARTATPLAALVARAMGHLAGTPGHDCTATRPSSRAPAGWSLGKRPMGLAAFSTP